MALTVATADDASNEETTSGIGSTFETCRLYQAMFAFMVTRETFAQTEFFSV
jgi:hypothetical protein